MGGCSAGACTGPSQDHCLHDEPLVIIGQLPSLADHTALEQHYAVTVTQLDYAKS
jgi:hypothetical protein